MKIKNLDGLRDHVLEVMEQLSSGKIDITEAGIVAKLSETIISGLKTQLDYARLTDQQPTIPFFGEGFSEKVIEQPKQKLLPKPK